MNSFLDKVLYYLRNDRLRDREPMPFNLFPFSFMVKLNIGPVREDHVVTANPVSRFFSIWICDPGMSLK